MYACTRVRGLYSYRAPAQTSVCLPSDCRPAPLKQTRNVSERPRLRAARPRLSAPMWRTNAEPRSGPTMKPTDWALRAHARPRDRVTIRVGFVKELEGDGGAGAPARSDGGALLVTSVWLSPCVCCHSPNDLMLCGPPTAHLSIAHLSEMARSGATEGSPREVARDASNGCTIVTTQPRQAPCRASPM